MFKRINKMITPAFEHYKSLETFFLAFMYTFENLCHIGCPIKIKAKLYYINDGVTALTPNKEKCYPHSFIPLEVDYLMEKLYHKNFFDASAF